MNGKARGGIALAWFSGVSVSFKFWPWWYALFLHSDSLLESPAWAFFTQDVKTASKLLSLSLLSLPDSSKSTLLFPLVLITCLKAPFSLFLPPLSLLLSLPDKKKRREEGFWSKQQESFVALISICKWRLTKVQTSLYDNSTAWPNLNEIYKIYLYK